LISKAIEFDRAVTRYEVAGCCIEGCIVGSSIEAKILHCTLRRESIFPKKKKKKLQEEENFNDQCHRANQYQV
jgi:hypothetical protein